MRQLLACLAVALAASAATYFYVREPDRLGPGTECVAVGLGARLTAEHSDPGGVAVWDEGSPFGIVTGTKVRVALDHGGKPDRPVQIVVLDGFNAGRSGQVRRDELRPIR